MERYRERKLWILSVGLAVVFSAHFLQPVVWALEAGASTEGPESGYVQSTSSGGQADAASGGDSGGSDPSDGTPDAGAQKAERPAMKDTPDNLSGGQTDTGTQKNERPSDTSGGTQDPETPDETQGPETPDGSQGGETLDENQGTETPDENRETETPDGSQNAETPDESQGGETLDENQGTETPDENWETETPDGSQDAETPDESQGAETPDENQETETPDGTQSAEIPDESQETENTGEVLPEEGIPEAPPAGAGGTTPGKITMDGSADDWDCSGIGALTPVEPASGTDMKVSQWRVARDESGAVYLCIQGEANEYQGGNAQWMSFHVTQNGETRTYQLSGLQNQGGAFHYQCGASGTSEAPYVLEVMIPPEYFNDPNFTITFGGCNVPVGTIPVLDGKDPAPGPDPGTEPEQPKYEGIGIDGTFADWDAVPKHDPHDVNGCIDQMAVVYDRDVYIYIREVQGGSAAGSGTHSNGKYAITTDLGEVLLFQLNPDGTVTGPEGVEVHRVGAEWEIRIPGSALPRHKQTISVGLYQAEPAVSDVGNMSGSGNVDSDFTGIELDGKYDDWEAYPTTQIQYATAGTQEGVTDATAALYAEGGILYGHATSTMIPHLDSKGGAFLGAISIAFNGDRDYKGTPAEGNFYPVIRTKDGEIKLLDGNTRLEDGTYTFEILDTRTAGNNPEVFGTMILTVTGGKDQMEFALDLEKVAAYIGVDAKDFHLIEAQFGMLGQEWVSTGGASSGPWLLVFAAAPVTALLCCRRKREEHTA